MTTSYFERLKYFISITDPTTLLYSKNEVEAARDFLRGKKSDDTTALQINISKMQQIVDAAVHPVTNEVIPRLFRMSAIAPVNIPIVFAMLSCPSSNIAGTVFLHVFNQSYNSACNYANRSGSKQSDRQLLTAYVLAVSSACTFALGLGKLINSGPIFLRKYSFIIPCLATSFANVSNICFTRSDEIMSGTTVFDHAGNSFGVSKVAGLAAVLQTAITRCVMVPCSCLLLPPLFMSGLQYFRCIPAAMNPRAKLLLELGIIYGSLQAALPASLAIFPQVIEFNSSDLEIEFRNIAKPDGGGIIHKLYANKGL